MKISQTPHFDPAWRDDLFDIQAIKEPLLLPSATPPNNNIWINVKPVRHEIIFGKEHVYDQHRLVTSVLKPSDMSQYYTVENQDGETLSADNQMMSALFPPQAWMSDSGEERAMMFEAAKVAKGRVLVAGLGLGVYPQFVLALHPSIQSLTIVERDKEVINLVQQGWLDKAPEAAKKVVIVEETIEGYLSKTDQVFDTIYLDTWEDADPRFLAHVNYLIALASHCCTDEGMIQCWGYAKMVETFVETVKELTEKAFPWDKYYLDPVLQAYASWLETQTDDLSEDMIIQAAKKSAIMTQQSIDTYERHRCFTTFGVSFIDSQRNFLLSRKDPSVS